MSFPTIPTEERMNAIATAALALIVPKLLVSAELGSAAEAEINGLFTPGNLNRAPRMIRCALCGGAQPAPVVFASDQFLQLPPDTLVATECKTMLLQIAAEMNLAGRPIVTIPSPLPKGILGTGSAVKNGVFLRVLYTYDLVRDQFPLRFDVFWRLRDADPAGGTTSGN